jgi:hypothetical protein
MKDNIAHKLKFTNETNSRRNAFDNYPEFRQSENPNINSNYITRSNLNSKSKTQLVMTNELHPNNYDLSVSNIIQPSNLNQSNSYTSGYMTGPGRGFGNLNISNSLRFGNTGRDLEIDNSNSNTSDNWTTLNINQKINNNIIPMDRNGESTRIKKSDVNTTNITDSSDRFIFKY